MSGLAASCVTAGASLAVLFWRLIELGVQPGWIDWGLATVAAMATGYFMEQVWRGS